MKKILGSVLFMLAILAVPATAQQIVALYDFGAGGATDLTNPVLDGIVAQGLDGSLYSTTLQGGFFGSGGAFQVTPSGTYSQYFDFNPVFLEAPASGLYLGADGYLYGAGELSEVSPDGVIFKIDPTGQFVTLLHGFNGTDGSLPLSPPIMGADGNLYGTTSQGGTFQSGTLYEITAGGVFTSLYSFDRSTNGYAPWAPPIQGPDGSFYGTTSGIYGDGPTTIFKFTPPSSITFLYTATSGKATAPVESMILGNDGNFYGAMSGDESGQDVGVLFKITPQGVFTVLHTFRDSGGQLYSPENLILGSDGNFYGAGLSGGAQVDGGIFRLTPGGKYTVLASFDGTNGNGPIDGLMQHTSGVFYGDTSIGGTFNKGVFYELNLGLKPFAGLVSCMGKVGTSVGILGQGFTTATGVSFNGGAAATFQIVSDTFLTATVPGAATTGLVTVKMPTGNLVSKQNFWVTPQITSFSPKHGPVGTSVIIKGTSLRQATQVSFGTVAATSFTVNTNNQVTAIVPTGAVTGNIVITTKGGIATSTGVFTVTP
jgi:uncharacterized repeat protein (TIGR03803 family)